MKILMMNWPGSVKFRGGDLTQMRKTAEALRAHFDCEVDETFDREPDASGYDVAHVFNLRTINDTASQVSALKKQGVPIVMSPIYLDVNFALWGTEAVKAVFGSDQRPAEMVQLLKGLRDRKLRITRENGSVVAADADNRSSPHYDDNQREILKHIDYLLPNSYAEMSSLMKTLRVTDVPFRVVPYAADASLFLDPDPEPFIKEYGVRDFVIQAGRLEFPKNQPMLAYALRAMDVPVVFVGGKQEAEAVGFCEKFGSKQLQIIEHLPQEMLASAYAAAKVHALPSWVETCGLVTMEAALANCSVVSSLAGYEVEYFKHHSYYCDPADIDSIRTTVMSALENYDSDQSRRDGLRELIQKDYTWENAARATMEAYQTVVG